MIWVQGNRINVFGDPAPWAEVETANITRLFKWMPPAGEQLVDQDGEVEFPHHHARLFDLNDNQRIEVTTLAVEIDHDVEVIGDVDIDGNLTTTGDAEIGDDLTVQGATVLNESGGDNNTRVESDGDENFLFGDAGLDRWGSGTATPDCRLHLHEGSAGVVDAAANTILAIENNTDAYINIIPDDGGHDQRGGLIVGDETDPDEGQIRYYTANPARAWEIIAGTVQIAQFSPTGLYVGVGANLPTYVLEVASAAGTNLAATRIRQADTNEPFILYDGAGAVNTILNITSMVGTGAVIGPGTNEWIFSGLIKIELQDDNNIVTDGDYWFPIYRPS